MQLQFGTTSDPEADLHRMESYGGNATLAILLGIVLEIALIWVPRHPGWEHWEHWGSTIANGLIGVGLVVEYICIRTTIVASKDITDNRTRSLLMHFSRQLRLPTS